MSVGILHTDLTSRLKFASWIHCVFVISCIPCIADIQGSDSSIPLSPQWLLPKMGESKHESGNEVRCHSWLIKTFLNEP